MPRPRYSPRKNKRGSGYLMPAEYYNPGALQPSSNAPALTTAPSPGFIRSILPATSTMSGQGGGKRKSRKSGGKHKSQKGGFVPEIMGTLVANAHSYVVPLALLTLYGVLGVKRNSTRKSKTNA